MKLATYEHAGVIRTGVVLGDRIVDTGIDGTMIDLIAAFDDHRAALAALDPSAGVPIADVRLRAPVLRPGKIFAIGLNYADHIAESKMETPQRQVWFTKAQTSINGPSDAILIARGAPYVDYEVEMVAIIGRPAKHVSADRAQEHVFGYCVGNDVTERMWQHAGPQWSLGKSFDTHAPVGPWITTADDVPDPHALGIRCIVNGETRQESHTGNLVFDVWQQIAHLSAAMTLEPGDMIFTGTPGGVGAAMDPRQFLKAGDVVRCEVDGLGAIEAVMEAEDGTVPLAAPVAGGSAGTPGAPGASGTPDGAYDIVVKTPMGDQKSTLIIATGGGAFTGKNVGANGVNDIAGTVAGNVLTWQEKITTPMPLTLDMRVAIDGDTVTGSAGAGAFGTFPLTGKRAG